MGTVFELSTLDNQLQAMLKAPRNLKSKLKFEAYAVVEAIEYITLLMYHKISAYLSQQRVKRVESCFYVFKILLILIGPETPQVSYVIHHG